LEFSKPPAMPPQHTCLPENEIVPAVNVISFMVFCRLCPTAPPMVICSDSVSAPTSALTVTPLMSSLSSVTSGPSEEMPSLYPLLILTVLAVLPPPVSPVIAPIQIGGSPEAYFTESAARQFSIIPDPSIYPAMPPRRIILKLKPTAVIERVPPEVITLLRLQPAAKRTVLAHNQKARYNLTRRRNRFRR